MKPTDLFTDLSDFQAYTDGLVADTTYEQLAPSIRTVVLSVMPLITANVYVALAGATPQKPAQEPAQEPGQEQAQEPAQEPVQEPAQEGEETPVSDEILLEGKELLKTAVAAGAMLKYQIFSSVKKNGSDASLYKYQHEEIKDSYAEAYWLAMDRLLDFLDENPAIAGYQETDEYAERQKLPVKTGREFDHYYGIGGSSFFFHKVLFLVRQTWRSDVKPTLPENPSEEMMELAKEALCYKVIAQAVMQFDVTELPRAIRWDYNHEYTKGSNPQARVTLYNQLISRYTSILSSIERMKAVASGTTTVGAGGNDEDDKVYTVL